MESRNAGAAWPDNNGAQVIHAEGERTAASPERRQASVPKRRLGEESNLQTNATGLDGHGRGHRRVRFDKEGPTAGNGQPVCGETSAQPLARTVFGSHRTLSLAGRQSLPVCRDIGRPILWGTDRQRTRGDNATIAPSLGVFVTLQPVGQQTAQQDVAEKNVHRSMVLTIG